MTKHSDIEFIRGNIGGTTSLLEIWFVKELGFKLEERKDYTYPWQKGMEIRVHDRKYVLWRDGQPTECHVIFSYDERIGMVKVHWSKKSKDYLDYLIKVGLLGVPKPKEATKIAEPALRRN